MRRLWMVAYDIDDDGKRRKVAKILKNHGVRVQFSVFECFLDNNQFLDLRMQLRQLLEAEDSLRWYPLCKWCRGAVFQQGQGKAVSDEGFVIV